MGEKGIYTTYVVHLYADYSEEPIQRIGGFNAVDRALSAATSTLRKSDEGTKAIIKDRVTEQTLYTLSKKGGKVVSDDSYGGY